MSLPLPDIPPEEQTPLVLRLLEDETLTPEQLSDLKKSWESRFEGGAS